MLALRTQPSERLTSGTPSNGDRSTQRDGSNARVATGWPSMLAVVVASPIPASDARTTTSNGPDALSRRPPTVAPGGVVSRTVSVAERNDTLAAGESQLGAVSHARRSSTNWPVAAASRSSSSSAPASSRSSMPDDVRAR